MVSPEIWNMKQVDSALRHVMRESGATIATNKPLYESDAQLPWWRSLLSLFERREPLQLLKDYPTNWTYVTITYRVKDTTVYVETVNFRVAED